MRTSVTTAQIRVMTSREDLEIHPGVDEHERDDELEHESHPSGHFLHV
jgi:hypothetical protein